MSPFDRGRSSRKKYAGDDLLLIFITDFRMEYNRTNKDNVILSVVEV